LKFIMSGAEPIRTATMNPFFDAFAQCGVKPSVFCSAYGLAEHVCGVLSTLNLPSEVCRLNQRAQSSLSRLHRLLCPWPYYACPQAHRHSHTFPADALLQYNGEIAPVPFIVKKAITL
jgi:acyl-CoA synthetase (AMP-forming)/AMP-acid ligase II